MKHPRDSLAGAAWGKLFPALSPKSWLSDSGRLWGALLDGLGRRRGPKLIIQPSRCKPPTSSQEGASWSEQAQGGRSQLFYSNAPASDPSQSTRPEKGQHSLQLPREGGDTALQAGTGPRPLSSAPPAPERLPLVPLALKGTRLPWAGTWKPWQRLHLRSTWIPTLMLFFLWERTFEETSRRLSSPSPPSLGRRALALHGPTALSSLGFPRIPWWGMGSGPSSEALWTGRPGRPALGDGSRLQRPRLTSKSSAEPDSSFCIQGSEPTLRRGEGRGWG